eukprot:GFKZ01014878.1.p1 GENE.GFKZ01014878.1~~GFKZ01014878.1.p1  ORF type:complete len:512 (-),score=64.75 GFKZ01014878.1:2089-3624(-)
MIISDFELQAAQHHFIAQSLSYDHIYRSDDPAEVRVLVRLPSASKHPNLEFLVTLQIKQNGDTSHDSSAVRMNEPPMRMTEVERFYVKASAAADFVRFQHVFTRDQQYELCVTFLINLGGNDMIKPIGSATFLLDDIIAADNERKNVRLMSPDSRTLMNTTAEFTVRWTKIVNAVLSFEVRMRVVDKNNGWPFATTKLFFILFRWEPQGDTWMPLYQSEVLNKPSDAANAKGAMVFELAETFLKKANDGVDTRPLRFEFFHLETTGDLKLLGYLSTSMKRLRQARKSSNLDLRLNSFQEGELSGNLVMKNSKITLNRHFFVIQADFGGHIKGNFICFDLTLTEEHRRPTWRAFRSLRPFYLISRCSDNGVWEQVYRSEVLTQPAGKKAQRYQPAKLVQRKLSAGKKSRAISISFYYERVGGESIGIGYFNTTVETLFEVDVGNVFPLSPSRMENSVDIEGYVRVEQAEAGDTFLLFAAQCILGKPPPADAVSPSPVRFDSYPRSSSLSDSS